MARIHVLDKSVSNMIAAGEVVSRPASAVKELIENAMDAGAKNITVEIKNGGISFLSVTDDGSGIEEDDILTAFMPHATSKIASAKDLGSIMTYGFRGEALSSIAAVSRITLVTKTLDADEAVKLELEGGEVKGSETVGAKTGTHIAVSDIFFNTPARYKFLKKDSAEAAAVTDVVQKAALSRPDISVRYISSGREAFKTQGDGNLLNAVYSLFGGDIAKHMIKVDYSDSGVRVTGYSGTAAVARPNRNMQIFFVNGRSVVSRTVSFALSEAYKNQLTVGRFPSAVLNIEVDPSAVDVNVHPSKTEVKFTDEKAIYDAVYWGVKNMLYEKPYVPAVESITKKQAEPVRPAQTEAPKEQNPIVAHVQKSLDTFGKKSGFHKIEPVKKEESKTFAAEERVKYEPKPEEKPAQQTIAAEETDDFTLIGQIFDTYLIAQKGSDMLLIDQHAAHERLNYEALKKKRDENEPAGQLFLVPEVISLSDSDMVVWEENREFFKSIGFETDKMGENDIMIRSAPYGTDVSDSGDVIREILTLLSDKRHDNRRTYLEERAMYTVSCKAAIKANMAISPLEQRELIKKVLALPGINTCPHGRPIMIKMTKEKIEKEFKRI